MKDIHFNRSFMKADYDSWVNPTPSDQVKGMPAPPLQREPAPESALISLPTESRLAVKNNDFYEILTQRRSLRQYADTVLTLEELSLLLEVTYRTQKIVGDNVASFRPSPSGGARHALEIYIAVQNVEGLDPGIYHYLPLSHQLECITKATDLEEQIIDSVYGQKFAGSAPAVFYWAAVPYRTEWRYGLKSHKVILLDLGHVAENLYLACEAIDAGACAIASYNQEKCDRLLKLDGEDEFVAYVMPVGKKRV